MTAHSPSEAGCDAPGNRVTGIHLSDLVEAPIANLTADQVSSAFNRSFEDYLVPLRFTAESYERRMRGENLDPYASSIYFHKGAPAGVILIARRGWTARVAAMAIAPPFRGQGLGTCILCKAIDDARRRGDRRMLLEVIEGNQQAMRLYTNAGFRVFRRLVGFVRKKTTPFAETHDILEEVDSNFVSCLILRQEGTDWPWNLSPQTLAALSPPARAFTLDGVAFAILSQKEDGGMLLHAIHVTLPQRRRGHGRRLLNALCALYPNRDWTFTPLLPEGLLDDWFLKNQWSRHPLAQLEMELFLNPQALPPDAT